MTNKVFSRRKLGYLPFLLPSLAGVMVFTFLPFADSVRRSFCTAVTGDFVGVNNYKAVFSNEAFRLAVKNTVKFVGVCLPLLISVSFLAAYALSRLKYIRLIKSVLLFPLAVPTAALVLVWQILFSDSGYINNILTSHGHSAVSFLSSSASFWVLVGSYIWKNLGYTVLLWLTGIMSVSTAVIDAAKVDGANDRQILFRIILPELKPTLYTITIISFLNSFKVFREAYLVAGAYPDRHIYLLQHLFNNWFVNMDLDKMAAAAVMVFAVILGAIILLRKAWDKEEQT
ncbi:multiple sugar transport system permease protein [Ruminococcus flavefaciens]|uniref:Multiple sugar transport system permease protein n=1 Tax=Ruminococcus flavefaciens TaxID=1265 RepID=A0A1H6IVK7_RUMFL|nr:sugar ABC transporter permease [Ruminococcus flavefaciens]SEH51097.1 multiple sugar transport system permease protein [Ruminococcus flavefaciens]